MNAIPRIIVQLVHIEGPMKGKIQELPDDEILIGRHSDCQVQFPKDAVILSRRHARILREGNRFKLSDQSTNGTYVNGRQVPEAYLKDGDVITFAEGGPKLSFLTRVSEHSVPRPPSVAQQPPIESQVVSAPPAAVPVAAAGPAPPLDHAPAVASAQAPFAIQYGAALKSFQTLPITLGKGADCHFHINHPALNDHQAQIFFARDDYWIKDLTGNNMIRINGLPIVGTSALQPDMQIALSPQGPKFRFLSGGRLAEVEDPAPEPSVVETPSRPDTPQAAQKPEATSAKSGGFFKKFFE